MTDQSKIKPLPPLAELQERFRYDPESGVLTYARAFGSKIKAGDRAGSTRTDVDGYRSVRVIANGRSMKLHRIVWKMHYGTEPPAVIDHINGDSTDNRICNLRAADHAANAHNKGRRKDCATGVSGVRFNAKARKFTAAITARGARIFLGYFPTLEEAASARSAAEAQHFGVFAAGNREGISHGH